MAEEALSKWKTNSSLKTEDGEALQSVLLEADSITSRYAKKALSNPLIKQVMEGRVEG